MEKQISLLSGENWKIRSPRLSRFKAEFCDICGNEKKIIKMPSGSIYSCEVCYSIFKNAEDLSDITLIIEH